MGTKFIMPGKIRGGGRICICIAEHFGSIRVFGKHTCISQKKVYKKLEAQAKTVVFILKKVSLWPITFAQYLLTSTVVSTEREDPG